MGIDLEFLVDFVAGAQMKTRYPTLEALLGVPVKVHKGQTVAREIDSGAVHQDGKRGPRIGLPAGKRAASAIGESMKAEGEGFADVTSLMDGYLAARGDMLVVSRIAEVFGDLYGNLTADAPVRIHGGAASGSSIATSGDVEVLGLVEEAEIRAGGNVILKGGFAGSGKGSVQAGRDFYSTFIQQGNVSCEGSIIVDGPVMNSDIAAGKKIVLRGRSTLVGGSARAKEEVSAPVVGSEGASPTLISLGYDPFYAKKAEEKKEAADKRAQRLDEAEKAADFAAGLLGGIAERRRSDPFPAIFQMSDMLRDGETEQYNDERKEAFHDLSAALLEIIYLRECAEKDTAEGDENIAAKSFPAASLKVDKVAHPGVSLNIMGVSLALDKEYEKVRFICRDGQIQAAML